MERQYEFLTYKISTDFDMFEKEHFLTPILKTKLVKLHKKALKGDTSAIATFHKLIERNPENPQLKNHLSTLYANSGNKKKAFEVNHWIIAEHPNYLFGKINLANEYYINEEYEKIPEILGEFMEIQKLYPKRDIFHFTEVIAFLATAIKYFAGIHQFDDANLRLDILEKLDEEGVYFENASQTIQYHLNDIAYERMKKLEKKRVFVTHVKSGKYPNKLSKPSFTHKIIESLYKNGFDIVEKAILNEILLLPKETLIQDLEKVLIDSIQRFDFYKKKADRYGYIDDDFTFVIHALFLLKEIKAKSSLPIVLDVLRQNEEYIDFFLNDFLTENIWEVLYILGNDDLELLKSFMLEKGLNTYTKSVITATLEQFFHHSKIDKDVIITWYKFVLNAYLKLKIKDNIIDSTLIGFMISELVDFDAEETLPLINKLFKKGYVDISVCGEFMDVEIDMLDFKTNIILREVDTIHDLYESLVKYSNIDDVYEDEDDTGYDNYIENITNSIISSNKVGRNAPCPCGSGKKYKKCCINK